MVDETPSDMIPVDPSLRQSLAAAAAWRGMSVAHYCHEVLARATRMDADLAASVQQGLDDIERGAVFSQGEIEDWFEARYRSAAAE